MDRIFGGILRSDVVCASCGYTSTAHDPFKDISVDILEPPVAKPQQPVVGIPKPNPVSASKSASKSNKGTSKIMQPTLVCYNACFIKTTACVSCAEYQASTLKRLDHDLCLM